MLPPAVVGGTIDGQFRGLFQTSPMPRPPSGAITAYGNRTRTHLSRVSGGVTERGGSTSHFASLARESGITMVLGVADATRRIPDGAQVAVDGVAGIVRWIS